jgi:cephalosporin hydroxylase
MKNNFTITRQSIDVLNNIITKMENKSFHNHYHIIYDICDSFNYDVTYLEIGAYAGGSASLASSHKNVKHVFSIDIGKPIPKEIPIRNVNNFKHKNCSYHYFEGSSHDSNIINDVHKNVKAVDILFIDGDHSYDAVLKDFNNFKDLVKSGGYIIFDDYLDAKHSPKVRGAVDFIVQNLNNDEFEILGSLSYPELKFTNWDSVSSNEFIIRKK